MEVHDFDGQHHAGRDEELIARLRSIRRGQDGAFILSHGGKESLFVHINGEAAFLGYFPDCDGQRPMSVPDGMWVDEQPDTRFLQVDGTESNAIWVSWTQLVPVDVAYQAAAEFMNSPALPPSVRWLEL